MTVLKTEMNKIYTSLAAINKIIAPSHVENFIVTDKMRQIAENPDITDEIKKHLLLQIPKDIDEEYRKNSLTLVNPFILRPNMSEEIKEKISSFAIPHINDYDEIHHVVGGSAIFGFISQNKEQQSLLILLPGTKIFIPSGVEHFAYFTEEYNVTIITYKTPFNMPGFKNTTTHINIKF